MNAGLLLTAWLVLPCHSAPKRTPRQSAPAAAPVEEAEPAVSPDLKMIQDLQEEIRQEAIKLDAATAEVRKLSESYAGTPDPRTLDAKRNPLRSDMNERLLGLREMLDRFKDLRKGYQFKRGTMIISKFLSGNQEPEVESDLKEVLALDRFPDEIERSVNAAQAALNQDANAYAASLLKVKAATQRKMLVAGVAGGVLLLGALIFWAVRRKPPRAQTVVGVPVKLATDTPPVPQLGNPAQSPSITATPVPTPVLGMNATPLPQPLQAGQLLGGAYRVVRELAKGTLGNAYEATEASGNRKVVVKRIRDEFHRSEKDLERFLAQARLVAGLKHPNLAEVYSVFVENERVHIAVEFVAGPALNQFLEAGNRIALPSVKRVLRQVLGALQYAHDKKAIHGDLTPSNILITREGVVKVTDFGIGLEARKIAARLSWTEPIGSPAYMAPEQELGSVFKESDLYSLGIVFYEMITGRLPFEGPNFLAQKREMRYQPPSRLAADIPKDVDLIIQKVLQPEPQRRYHTAQEFCAAMETLPEPGGPAPGSSPSQTSPGSPGPGPRPTGHA
ncbi:MAG: protein kinase [Elusimicrobiota bacterium]